MSLITEFYSEIGQDSAGRTLSETLSKSDDWMDACHDYIQSWFPLTEPSNFNDEAPLLREEDIAWFKNNPDNVYKTVDRYLAFLGINPDLTLAGNFESRCHLWMGGMDHNHLRISRLLKFLCLIGQRDRAVTIVRLMEETSEGNLVRNSLRHWKAAVKSMEYGLLYLAEIENSQGQVFWDIVHWENGNPPLFVNQSRGEVDCRNLLRYKPLSEVVESIS